MIRTKLFNITLCVLLIFLTSKAKCAPQYAATTQSPNLLTTIKYYSNVTPKTRMEHDYQDYYEEYPPKKKDPSIPTLTGHITPSELLMTLAKTALEIVRKVNAIRSQKNVDNSTVVTQTNTTSNVTKSENARGMDHDIYYSDVASHDHDHYHHHEEPPPPPPPPTTTTTEAPMKPRYSDPWAGYYDFIINEGSFKFWSGFQLFTAALLLYSALAAIYFAKFNPIQPDYDTTYDDYFFGRSLDGSAPEPSPSSASPDPGWINSITGMGAQAYQKIMDTLYSPQNKYT